MNYLSFCSGIEAASVAWHHLGWNPVGFSEIEKFPSQVLAARFPTVPNFGDMTKFKDWDLNGNTVDLIVGGTPCQSFSVAGLRRGLEDQRGNLSLVFCQAADYFDPEFVLWENVPGVLSDKGNAFGCFLAGLSGASEPITPNGRWTNAGLVSGQKRTIAWRVLDAQYVRVGTHPYAVPQRRRRIFVLAVRGSGNWAAASTLFTLTNGMCGNPAPSRKAGQEVADGFRNGSEIRSHWDGEYPHPTLNQSAKGSGGVGFSNQELFSQRGAYLAPFWPAQVAPTLNASFGSKQGLEDQHIRGGQDCSFQVAKCLITKTRMDAETETLIPTNGGHFSYALAGNTIGRKPENGGNGLGYDEETMYTLTKTDLHGVVAPIAFGVGEKPDVAHCLRSGASKADKHESSTYIQTQMQVRRLTPVECERLQGFPDGWTDIQMNGKPTPDGPRYKALGNSMAVNVMSWIGDRIQMVLDSRREAA